MRKFIVSFILLIFVAWGMYAAPAQEPLIEMARIPAGKFHMGDAGSSQTRPVREVTISHDFLFGRYEVTNELFAKVVNYLIDVGFYSADDKAIWNVKNRQYRMMLIDDKPYYHQFGVFYRAPYIHPVSGHESHPVYGLDWQGAIEICNGLSRMEGLTPVYGDIDARGKVEANWAANGYRLPTEAEWEYAARGGDRHTIYPWGNTIDPSFANYRDSNHPFSVTTPLKIFWDSWKKGGPTTTVGFFDGERHGMFQTRSNASPFGIFDMAGNVSEWCWDNYTYAYKEDSYSGLSSIDPRGALMGVGKVSRGGGFLGSEKDLAVYARKGGGLNGFRIARSSG